MPVDLNVPHAAPIKIAEIGSTDTIEFHAASNAALGVPNCNFAGAPGARQHRRDAAGLGLRRDKQLPAHPDLPPSWDVVAKWTSPGITVTTRSAATGKQLTLYSTGPVTYYVDLDTMPNSPGSSATFTQTMQALESFIRTTLLQNIPVIDKIALFQATTDRSQVADPLGRLVGVGSGRQGHPQLPRRRIRQGRRPLGRLDLRAGARHLSRHRPGQGQVQIPGRFHCPAATRPRR